jgi:hypothetical protein
MTTAVPSGAKLRTGSDPLRYRPTHQPDTHATKQSNIRYPGDNHSTSYSVSTNLLLFIRLTSFIYSALSLLPTTPVTPTVCLSTRLRPGCCRACCAHPHGHVWLRPPSPHVHDFATAPYHWPRSVSLHDTRASAPPASCPHSALLFCHRPNDRSLALGCLRMASLRPPVYIAAISHPPRHTCTPGAHAIA